MDIGEAPTYIKCPKSFTAAVEETQAMQARVCMRQETVNKRFKHFGILKQVFRHYIPDHGDVFRAVLTQISILNGEPLFSTGYRDPPYNNPFEVEDTDPEWDGINVTEEVQAAITRNSRLGRFDHDQYQHPSSGHKRDRS